MGMRHKAGMGNTGYTCKSTVKYMEQKGKSPGAPHNLCLSRRGKQQSLALGSLHPYQNPLSLLVTSFRSRIQHRNSIVLASERQNAKFEQKEDRTPVQPKAYRGHYDFKEPPGSHMTSRSKYKPQGPDTISGKTPRFSHDLKVQLRSQEPPGSHMASGFQIRSQDLRKILRVPIQPPGSSHDPKIQMRTSGFPYDLWVPNAIS
ncbi:hypothetical protein F2Q68_00025345 [Brassica cretica]|uniref:Uncharacterized protein n=1 Tax=Brassica cretica TaxID=69181 RepID=A0A8S9IAU1_BRACR|nr:hypothetical protein F2Q68_00025345 [Brassica cretica]